MPQTTRLFGLCLVLAVVTAQAQDWKVGDRVAMPAGYADKWLDAVVIRIDPGKPYPYRVHPLGYEDTMDQSFDAKSLKATGSIKTEVIATAKTDPVLLKLSGAKPFHPTKLYRGAYECWSWGHAAMMLNFSIVDGDSYRDVSGKSGHYSFDADSGKLQFKGAALDGVQGSYTQSANPPLAQQPPTVTIAPSGDECQAKL